MEETERTGTLEIEEDIRYQRRFWKAQRFGWMLMTLIIASALLGFFGPGVFGKTRLGSASLEVEYDRTLRMNKLYILSFIIKGEPSGERKLHISAPYMDAFFIEGITPAPDRVESVQGYYIFVFNTADARFLKVSFFFKPSEPGSITGSAALDLSEPLAFSQFIYP